MGTRGRRSAASLQVVRPGEAERIERPAPPADLSDEQAEVWRVVVESEPAELVRPAVYGLLSDYCRHVVRGRRVAELIAASEGADDLDVVELDRLYKMAERESRAASSLATRLRLTPQATVSKKIGKPSLMARPWD